MKMGKGLKLKIFNMKQNFISVSVLLLITVIFLSGCAQYGGKQTQISTPVKTSQPTSIAGNVIGITSSGFSPNALTISAGETVAFINKDSEPHWPASAMHPTHKVYPESGGCIGSKFDACRGLEQSNTFSFTFNQKGTWKYHDHLNPSLTGAIVVE